MLDYLHRLLRGTSLYLKLGTVRHRTTMHRSNGQSIGVEPGEDIEEINLDRTFDDVTSTQEFLELMLDEMAGKIGIESASDFISPEGLLHLTLASGGVPRDYLNTLVEAIPAARSANQKRVSPTSVYKGAGRLSYRNKLSNLREEAGNDATAIERVFSDLATFCLQEQKTTGFLISQEEVGDYSAEHEIIQQLMDFKLIHVVEPDTSAASNREGRYEAYTLDFALFMEPRLRNMRHMEFWKVDERSRRKGVREAPDYPLARARRAAAGETQGGGPESVMEEIERRAGVEPDVSGEAAEARLFPVE